VVASGGDSGSIEFVWGGNGRWEEVDIEFGGRDEASVDEEFIDTGGEFTFSAVGEEVWVRGIDASVLEEAEPEGGRFSVV